ncbi:unnamed protein product [Orchesella dallaii]|uniref:Sodium-dependent multivitamin transporter n=1 Tax=Orchesella dallaii TaxID=48710 RepID=A0ABP1R028_9HEXA
MTDSTNGLIAHYIFFKLQYLERRFDSVWVRWLTSFTFILQVLLINGVILYAPAIALEAIVGLPIWLSVSGIGLIGTVYTSVGGLKAVVWTDVFQFFMIMLGMFSIVTKGFIKAGGIITAFNIAAEKGRLILFE